MSKPTFSKGTGDFGRAPVLCPEAGAKVTHVHSKGHLVPGSPGPFKKLPSEPRETEAQSRNGVEPTSRLRPQVPLTPPPTEACLQGTQGSSWFSECTVSFIPSEPQG